MGYWQTFHRRPWWLRWPVKLAILALTVVAVAYPHPGRLVTHLQRWQNPATLIDADAPALQSLVNDLRARIPGDLPAKKVLRVIQEYVYGRIPYAWDWDTWGVADYIPTVEEALQQGREDCDGRAVVAASLLRALGHRAELVSDYAHVWVRTEAGETMSPGRRKNVVASDAGVQIQWRNLADLVTASAYGWAVFPLQRELIVIAVLWLLIVAPGTGWRWRGVIALLLLDALLRLRLAGRDPRHPIVWLQGIAAMELVVALWLARFAARRVKAAPPHAAEAA